MNFFSGAAWWRKVMPASVVTSRKSGEVLPDESAARAAPAMSAAARWAGAFSASP
jgi:hypothetical protein